MANASVAVEIGRLWAPSNLRRCAPGIILCCAIASIAFFANYFHMLQYGRVLIPPLIVTLVIGMALQPLSNREALKAGLDFSGRTLLRLGVALYGAQLTLGQLVDGGALPVVIAIAAVACTITFGATVSKMFGLGRDFGFLTGCACGVCGAAAAMATSAVLPRHPNSDRDLAFAVMGVNFISTVTMVLYPPLHLWLGYSHFEMGVFLGGSIGDVAQVAGAGQTLGPDILKVSIITKLLRVACLLPAVTAMAWWVARGGVKVGDARPSPPVFLFGFLLLACINSTGALPYSAQFTLAQVSSFLITAAIAALGMKTSLLAMARIGGRSVLLMILETAFVGVLVALLIYGLRHFGM
jgi:uncharacterized integral membrane protein (TIGR00698 family)